MEYCPLGNLRHLIDDIKNNNKNKLKIDADISYIFSMILKGILVLQEKNIIHCNIKPENILFKSKNEILIGDYCISETIFKKKSNICGAN